MCVKITWKKQISTAKTRNDYCKMCSGHRQQSRSNHCVKRLSTLDVPVVSQFETTCTCITNGKSCTMKLMLIYNILADNVELERTGLLLIQRLAIKSYHIRSWGKKLYCSAAHRFWKKHLFSDSIIIHKEDDSSVNTDYKFDDWSIFKTWTKWNTSSSSQIDKDTDVKIKDGCFRVVYVTAETFFNDSGAPSVMFSQLLQGGNRTDSNRWSALNRKLEIIQYIYIYTTHTHIYDLFRSAFKHTFPFCQNCTCPIMALTATATQNVKNEIISILRDQVLIFLLSTKKTFIIQFRNLSFNVDYKVHVNHIHKIHDYSFFFKHCR